MIWWFIVLGFSALVVVCVAIAIYLRIRRHLKTSSTIVGDRHDEIEPADHV
jgi:hypothetical protein